MKRGLMGIMLSAAGGALLGAGAVALAVDARIDGHVKSYILDHPEVIPQAMKQLQLREAQAMVARNRAALETPFAGAWAGAPRGDVTLVMFSDYACGYCRASLPDIERLLREDKGLKVVWREVPILGPRSEAAAKAALNAATQGRYLEVHRSLFAKGQSAVPPADTPAITRELQGNIALARALGVSGTPTFVIGDRVMQGAVGYDALKRAIAEARATKA